jgi:hypothetical protein
MRRSDYLAIVGATVGALAGGVIGVLAVWLNQVFGPPGAYYGAIRDFLENCLLALVVGTVIGTGAGYGLGLALGRRRPK